MKPRIAITMGDPGGVGPEVILKALARPDVANELDPVIVGGFNVIEKTCRQLELKMFLTQIESLQRQDGTARSRSYDVAVYQPSGVYGNYTAGTVSAENGAISHACIVAAARAALNADVDAICTAPIAKEALFLAGFTVPGHTELLASLCGQDEVRMMLVGGGLNVVLQTIHVALKNVPALLTQESILQSLRMIRKFAAETGNSSPKIGVCGLNPHAGEGGHFGDEEPLVISPAVQAAAAEGISAIGPLPADTVFYRMLQGDFDFVLAMYHDQGLIPVKTLDFHGGVNVTVGLPIIRTSPDHGTAFNIAGQCKANESSMVAALLYAADLARKKA